MSKGKSQKTSKRKQHNVFNFVGKESFVKQSMDSDEMDDNPEELTKQELIDENNFLVNFIRKAIVFVWLVAVFFFSIPFALTYTDKTLLSWALVFLSVISIQLSWCFWGKKKKEKLWKSTVVPLGCSIFVLSIKWFAYIWVLVVLNMLIKYQN